MYDIYRSGYFKSPRGAALTFYLRHDTNDHNTIQSCTTEDEYGLAPLFLGGHAIDVGAQTGGVTIALLVDNPDLRVSAIEPVPPNLDLLAANAEANGVADRLTIVDAAAAAPGDVNVPVWYGWTGAGIDDPAMVATVRHHAFVGNNGLGSEGGGAGEPLVRYPACVSLGQVVQDDTVFCKIDCEGCEYGFLSDSPERLPLIIGEWHPCNGIFRRGDGTPRTRDDIHALLDATHDVTFGGPVAGPGSFRAVRRD